MVFRKQFAKAGNAINFYQPITTLSGKKNKNNLAEKTRAKFEIGKRQKRIFKVTYVPIPGPLLK
jgi:hypothetical protein